MIPGLTWLTPAIAGVAAAVAVPLLVLLYFLKLRRRDVEISSTLLWKRAVQDLQANAPFQRLRRNILLLLQLLALAAVLLALAQPQLAGESAARGRHVIAIDRGASMRATDGPDGVSRLESARERARALVDALREPGLLGGRSADEAMVIAFDARAEVVQPFTSDKRLLRQAIERIRPTDTPSDLDAPLRLARAQAPQLAAPPTADGEEAPQTVPGPVGTIHLFTDGRLAGGDGVDLHRDDEIRYERVGELGTGNVGITAIDARRQVRTPAEVSVLVGLQSSLTEQTAVSVELLVDGAPAGARRVTLPPADDGPTTGGVAFDLELPSAAVIEARLRAPEGGAPDAFDRDDRGWAVVPDARRLRVALVTRGNLFLREGLASLPIERVEVFEPEGFADLLDAQAAMPDRFDAVVLDGWLPPRDEASPTGLPPGRWLVFDAVPTGPGGLADLGEGPAAEIIDWSRDHPIVRQLTLAGVAMFSSRLVEAPEDGSATVLATSDRGPAIVALEGVRTRAVVVPWNVQESNWPLRPSFVVFLGQALRSLSDTDGETADAPRPGATHAVRLDTPADSVRVRTPGGRTLEAPVGPDGRAVFGPLDEVGVYTLSWDDGAQTDRLAVNLASADESVIRAAEELSLRTERVAAIGAQGRADSRRPLWPWLVGCGIALVLVEWYVYNRKVRL